MPVAGVVTPDRHLESQKRDLWFVTAISNPPQWRSRYNLYRDFRKHVTEELGCNLLTVECALGGGHHVTEADCCHPDGSSHTQTLPSGVKVIDVRVRNSSWVWLKENLWNVGVRFLPSSADTIVFADADIRFLDPLMPLNTIYHLNGTYKVVQPFETCADLGPSGEIMTVHKSFGWCIQNGLEWGKVVGRKKRKDSGCGYGGYGPLAGNNNGQNLFHPGYAMAMKKSTWSKLNGLLEVGAAGAGDHHMCCAMINRGADSYPSTIHENYKAAVAAWEARAKAVVRGSFGWINGTIMHGYHGKKAKRKYIERWDILVKNRFDPLVDVYKNADGVMELTGDNQGLRNELQAYFRSRNEDDGDL